MMVVHIIGWTLVVLTGLLLSGITVACFIGVVFGKGDPHDLGPY